METSENMILRLAIVERKMLEKKPHGHYFGSCDIVTKYSEAHTQYYFNHDARGLCASMHKYVFVVQDVQWTTNAHATVHDDIQSFVHLQS